MVSRNGLCDAAPTSRAMVVAVMVSMVAFLDSTVINLALPAIEHDLGGGLTLQQWIVDGYLLAMAAAILPGGGFLEYESHDYDSYMELNYALFFRSFPPPDLSSSSTSFPTSAVWTRYRQRT